MTKVTKRAIPMLLAVLLSIPATAEIDEPTAQKFMRETVLWDAMSEISKELRDGITGVLTDDRNGLNPAIAAPIVRGAAEAFSREMVQDAALESMRKELDAATVDHVRRWNATPLGQKLLSVEKANAVNLYFSWKQMRMGAEFRNADEIRRKALTDIIDATRVTEAMVQIAAAAEVATVRGMVAAQPAARGMLSEEQLRNREQATLGAAKQIRELLVGNYAALYVDFSTEELQQYVGFLHSPAAMKMQEIALTAVRALLKDRTEDFLRRLPPS